MSYFRFSFFMFANNYCRLRAESVTGEPEEEWVPRSVSERIPMGAGTDRGFARSSMDICPHVVKSLKSTGSTSMGDTASTGPAPPPSHIADDPLTMPHTALVYQSLEGKAPAVPGPRGTLSVKALRKTGYRAQEFSESMPILYNDLQIPITNVKKL